jgi:hypothetical protein
MIANVPYNSVYDQTCPLQAVENEEIKYGENTDFTD